MYTLTYNNKKAGVLIEGKYIYEFETKEKANEAVKRSTKVNVLPEHGTRNTVHDITPAVMQRIKIIPPASYDIE